MATISCCEKCSVSIDVHFYLIEKTTKDVYMHSIALQTEYIGKLLDIRKLPLCDIKKNHIFQYS